VDVWRGCIGPHGLGPGGRRWSGSLVRGRSGGHSGQRAAVSGRQVGTKLASFYAERTLTKQPITLADQAEASFVLASNRLSKTTGQVINVDGGLHEAFLR
jgi:hypothetical protein